MSTSAGGGWIVDASVAVKWFKPASIEPDSDLARAAIGNLPLRTTSLAFYETGNVLSRAGQTPERIAANLDVMSQACGSPVELKSEDFAVCAEISNEYGITFYDASYVAIARRLKRRVLSADSDLLAPGLASDLRTALA